MRNYLKPYGHGKSPGTSLKCRWEDRIDKQNWCHVSRRKLIDWTHDVHCSRSENFGFALAQPCIIIKVRFHKSFPDFFLRFLGSISIFYPF